MDTEGAEDVILKNHRVLRDLILDTEGKEETRRARCC